MSYESIKNYFAKGLWSADMVKDAVKKDVITMAQYEEITEQKYALAVLNTHLKRSFLGALRNCNYDNSITKLGDTVNYNGNADITLQNADGTLRQISNSNSVLTIDYSVSYNFSMSDAGSNLANEDSLDASMSMVVNGIVESGEYNVLSKCLEEAGSKYSGAIPTGGVYELIVMLKMAMDEKNVPRSGRALVVPPAVEAELLLDARVVTGNGAISGARPADGVVARVAGFDIYASNNSLVASGTMVGFHPNGITFASQTNHTENGDVKQGVYLYGVGVSNADYVTVFTLTA